MTDISNFKFILDAYSAKEKVQLLKELYQDIAGYGINGDEELAHVNSFEVDILKSLGGSGTINKITELPQYFGGGRRPESKEVSEAKLPSEIAPYIKDILEESQRLYGEAKDEKYQEEPQTVAEVTEKEKLAREGLIGLMGTRDPYLKEGLELYRGGTEKPTVEGIQEYMSPYQQLVTDIDKQKAQEAHEAGRAAFEARGVGAGGMSGMGTRMGLEAALREGRHGENLAAIQARGSQKAYEDAQRVFQMQKQRERQAAGDIIGTGEDIYGAGLADYGLQAQVGEQERADTQQQLDDLYRRWTQKQDFPETELAKYSGFVYGNPFMRGQADTTTTRTGAKGPSWGQQLFGAGVKLGGAYLGAPGVAAQGGRVSDYRARHGGGLHDILETRYRYNGGYNQADLSDVISEEELKKLAKKNKGTGLLSSGFLEALNKPLRDSSDANLTAFLKRKAEEKFGPGKGYDPYAGITKEEEMEKTSETRAAEREKLAKSQQTSGWDKGTQYLGALAQSIGAGLMAGPKSTGGGWYEHTSGDVMNKALDKSLDAIRRREELERKTEHERQTKKLETKYTQEDLRKQIPRLLQKRIQEIRDRDISWRQKEALIKKAKADALLSFSQAQYGKRRKVKYPLTKKKADQLWTDLRTTPARLQEALGNDKDIEMLKSLKTSEGREFAMSVDAEQNRNDKLEYEAAVKIVFDQWKRRKRFKKK